MLTLLPSDNLKAPEGMKPIVNPLKAVPPYVQTSLPPWLRWSTEQLGETPQYLIGTDSNRSKRIGGEVGPTLHF